MKAIVLAAGVSSRIRSLTQTSPKACLKIDDDSLIKRQIKSLQGVGIDEIVVVVGYKKESIYKELDNYDIIFVSNNIFESSNSAYSLWLAKDMLCGNEFITLNCDLLFHQSYLSNFINNRSSFCCVIDSQREIKSNDSFRAFLDHEDNIIEFKKNLDSDTEVPGPFIFDGPNSIKLFNYLDENIDDIKNEWAFSVYNTLAKDIKLKGVKTNMPWVEIDDIDDYNQALQITKEDNEK